MKCPFLGCILFGLPLLAFVACGDESAVNVNSVKQIAVDDESTQDDDADSKESDTPVSSGKQSTKSSSSEKSSEKSSSSANTESFENDEVDSVDDLPRCSIKREGKEIYVKENKTHYTCEDGEWIAEKKTPEDSKKSSSSEADEAPKSSSSVIYLDVDFSSSSAKVTTVPVTGLGSCQPVTPVINKSESTKWKFSANVASDRNAFDFVKATYVWNFGAGATPATDATSGTSAAISYANSGVSFASVTVTMPDGNSETVQCEPLQVNGDPITGCMCETESAVVDFTETPTVSWSVTGCTSMSAVTSYVWNGVDGTEATYTHTFTAATNAYAPTLKVANDDNTIVDVSCDAVKVTEGPEYEINQRGNASDGIDLPAGKSMVHLNIPEDDYYYDCMIYCQSNAGEFSVSIDGSKVQSGFFVALQLPDRSCFDRLVEFELSAPAKCSLR